MNILIKFYYLFSVILFSATSFAFSGGTGTVEDPYLLRTCPELQSMISFPSAHFQLADNINCNGFDYGDGGGFMPVGSSAYPFIGTLDGDNFTISNLNINRSTQNYVGLIGYMSSYQNTGIIKNVHIANASIIGKDYVGGVVGYSPASGDILFTNNHYEGYVTGNQMVGGLIGSSGVNVLNSHASGSVTATSRYVGGLVGYSQGGITDSFASGQVQSTSAAGSDIGGLVGWFGADIFERNHAASIVKGYDSVGGLVGGTSYTNIKNSFFDGEVYGTLNVGGLVGDAINGNITDSYTKGEAHADHYVGGLIGKASATIVTNSYAATLVTGTIYSGGLTGYGTSTVNSSYWDRTVSGQPYSVGGTPKTTEEMYQQATYVNWNFNNIWQIDENMSYPYFRP